MIQLTLSSNKNHFTWQPDVSMFLYSYIYRFTFKHVVSPFDEIKLDLNNEMCNELIVYLETALEDSIGDLYKEPDLKMLNKHSSRFEKVIFKDKKYRLNCATSPTGRMIYSVYNVYNFLKKEMEKNEYISLILGKVG